MGDKKNEFEPRPEPPSDERYWLAVRAAVCKYCVDGDGNGNCRLSPQTPCPLERHFPQVLSMVRRIKSDAIDPYVEAVEKLICTRCDSAAAPGVCFLRMQLECGLDRHLPEIVQAIKDVDKPSWR